MPARPSPDAFDAGAFHPDYGTRRIAGTLRIEGGMVNFQGELGFFAFPLDTVQVSLGGASDRLVFFAHENYPILVNSAPFLLTQKFSRDHEREANEQGFRYLEAAKLNPRGMISFFEKKLREEEKLREKLPGGEALDALSFLSTHPATIERTERLEKLLAKSPRQAGFTAVDLDFKAFQQALRAKLSQPEVKVKSKR